MPVSNRPLAAVLAIVFAMVLLGFADNLVLLVSDDIGLWQFHAVRGAMALPFLVAATWWVGAPFVPAKLRGVVGRTVFLVASMLIYFGSLGIVPISVAVAGLFTSPIFVLILTAVVWRRQVGWVRWASAIVGFVGILFVIRPDPSDLDAAMFVPILSGLFYAVGAIATRQWCEGESAFTLTLYSFAGLFVAGCVGLVAVTLADGDAGFVTRPIAPLTREALGLLFVMAVISIFGVGLIIQGYLWGEATFVAIFEYTLLATAAIWSWVIHGEVVTGTAVFGMALIVVSGGVIALRSAQAEQ